MKGINLRKAFLLSGILLLSVFMAIQLSWACDDDDKWDRDWHHKWHWDHQCLTCDPPKIEIVYVDYFADSIELNIWGKNFDSGIRPVVTLGGIYKLNVEDGDYSDTHIIATLPLQNISGNFVYGDYRLIVSTCHDSACKYCKDYCSKCKDKHCRDYCSKCKDRYCKKKYCKDCGHKCRCKDRYSLTIAAPAGQPGPPGPPGTTNFQIVEVPGVQPTDGSGYYGGTAYCGSGFKVTGGGFFQNHLNITLSGPVEFTGTGFSKIDNGWRVEGAVAGQSPSLRIWAVCAQVE